MNNNFLFVGIDISKLKHDIAIMNEHKKLMCKHFIIKEDHAGYCKIMDTLKYLKQREQVTSFYIGMEATADYWKNLFHFFRNQDNCIPIVINPVKTKAFAKTELRRAKTDKVNAKDIALFLVEKKPKASYYRPPILDNIKDMHTQIAFLGKLQSMATSRLRIELCKVAPEIEHHYKNIKGKQILAVLKLFPSAEAIWKASDKKIKTIRYSDKQWKLSEPFIKQVKKLTSNSIAYKSGPNAGNVVQALIRNIYHFQNEILILKEQVEQLYDLNDSNNAELLASIKGVTKETAIILDAYFADISRFNNVKEFVAFFGMNPVINQSGKQNNNKSYLERKGSGVVRRILYLATLTLIRHHVEPFDSFYNRLVSAGKPKLVALCATMRKLLVIMYYMITKQEKFNSGSEN